MANGWWNDNGAIANTVAAWQAVSVASLAASKSNLFNPGTNDLAAGSDPSWATGTGWTFNGTSQYLVTTLTSPGPTWTYIIRFANASSASGNKTIMGTNAGGDTSRVGIAPFRTTTDRAYRNTGLAYTVTAGSKVAGVMAVAGATAYLDGASDGACSNDGAAPGTTLGIGAFGDGIQFQPCDVLAAAVYSATLTAGNIATITAAMNALGAAAGKGLPVIAHWHADVFGGGV